MALISLLGPTAQGRFWSSVSYLCASPTAICGTNWAPLLGKAPDYMTPGQMTYHPRPGSGCTGTIERIPGTHRYRVTKQGGRLAPFFCTRTYNRLLHRVCSGRSRGSLARSSDSREGFDDLDAKIEQWMHEHKMVA